MIELPSVTSPENPACAKRLLALVFNLSFNDFSFNFLKAPPRQSQLNVYFSIKFLKNKRFSVCFFV